MKLTASLRAFLLSFMSILFFSVCQNPFGFAPHDPQKQDPPAPPVQIEPKNDTLIPHYAYPQDVTLKWKIVSGAYYYQVEVYTDSLPVPEKQYVFQNKVYGGETTVRFYRHGAYWWRVRGYSPNWKWYTDWSPLAGFILPNPAKPATTDVRKTE